VEDNLQRGLFRAGAGGLFASVLALLFAVSDPAQAVSVLFVVPIAVLALSDGLRGGAVGALVATALTAVWVHSDDVHLNVLGWGSRIISFLMIGLLVGRYQDLARAYERRRLDERYAGELHDRVVQSLVLARYQLRDNDDPSAAVDTALANAKEIISERLGDVRPGDLRLSRR
jgi:signal transduction histidine kinase